MKKYMMIFVAVSLLLIAGCTAVGEKAETEQAQSEVVSFTDE